MFDTLKRIKELREERKWSVYRLALLSGIPQSTIATWYQKNLSPPIDKLEILCKTFEISLSEFFCEGSPRTLTEEQEILLAKWNQLDSRNKNAVLLLIDALLHE